MSNNSPSTGFEFVVAHLERDPDAVYATVREAADRAGHVIYPIMYGRAKAKLGLVAVDRGEPARNGTSPAKAPVVRARAKPLEQNRIAEVVATRARTAPPNGTLGQLETVIRAMQSNESTRKRYRGALEQIRAIVDEVLDSIE